ncbi:MAG: haloacid dehalogenase [Desulfurococcaceae archaeon]
MGWIMGCGSEISKELAKEIESIDAVLREKDNVREEVIKLSREIVRISGQVVSLTHRNDYSTAREYINTLVNTVNKLKNLVENHPEIKYSGLVYGCLSEYVEARVFYSIVTENRIPGLDELGVTVVPYLQGLGDVIGELRRLVIRLLDVLEIEKAEKYLEVMETIFEKLKVLDYPDALVPGLRHKVDVASRLIEDTRVLIINTKNSVRCLAK